MAAPTLSNGNVGAAISRMLENRTTAVFPSARQDRRVQDALISAVNFCGQFLRSQKFKSFPQKFFLDFPPGLLNGSIRIEQRQCGCCHLENAQKSHHSRFPKREADRRVQDALILPSISAVIFCCQLLPSKTFFPRVFSRLFRLRF